MSFILDALKKSEAERQQQSGADLAGVPTSPGAASIPRWLRVVGVLLAINLVVLLGLFFRPSSLPVESSMQQDTATSELQTPVLTASPSFEEQVDAAKLNPPKLQMDDPEPDNSLADTVRPILISQDPASIPAADIYPTIHEVRASGKFQLSELHLDIHVYNADPKDRFVFINMAKLREGSKLEEGPVVTEITPDGVVLRHQGQVFLLPRD